MRNQKTVQVFLENALRDMLAVFMLSNYFIEISFDSKLKPLMEMDVDHKYLQGDITYGEEIVEMFFTKPDKVYDTLCHEVTHILTSQLVDEIKGLPPKKAVDLEERVNEHISKIFLLALKWSKL